MRSIHWLDAIREFSRIRRNSRLSLRDLLGYSLYFSAASLRIWKLRRKFAYIRPEYLVQFPNVKKLNKGFRNIYDMQAMEIEHFQLPHLLRYEDRNSMHHSIEARLPFLDYKVVETAFGMNNRFKINQGWSKHVLRTAMAGVVPESILWRKGKLGFEAPESAWIGAARANMISAIDRSQILNIMSKRKPDFGTLDSVTFWKLFSIAKWEEIYAVQPPTPATQVRAAAVVPVEA